LAPTSNDVVLEIGPGRGALTSKLIDRVGKLYALEFDRDLAELLRNLFHDRPNFEVIEDDALKVDLGRLAPPGNKLRLIANLPYNISTAILQRLFEHKAILSDCVLMFQREVVERIMAPPSTSDRGYLSVLAQAHFEIDKLFDVPPQAFRPVPKVWSSVVRLRPRTDIAFDHAALESIVSLGFMQRRKTIVNNLKNRIPSADDLLANASVDPSRRAETLTVDEWLRLADLSRH
jgi:16S rRNA (adenine1518-N6/adenine1519-N6)-dimethyltransferase